MASTSWTIPALVERHPRIAFDADVLIYLLDGAEPRAALAGAAIDALEPGVATGSMSSLALAEILVGPARQRDASQFERTAEELRDLDLEIVPVSRAIAEDAAWLRGRDGLKLADAIHVAAARSVATAFITNDRRIRSSAGLEVFHLDDLVA